MSTQADRVVAGVDAGSECVKVMLLDGDRRVIARSTVPTRGSFQDCIQEAMSNVLEDAQLAAAALRATCVTGFAASCATLSTLSVSETACHARGAHHHRAEAMTVIDLGGRDPKVLRVAADGRISASRGMRKCGVGIGTFLMFTARHLDVHPTRLMDLAATAGQPARVGSYCSVFAEIDVLEQLRRGATPGEVALGAMYSIAERILEVGGLAAPLVVTGGVCEYFPGVIHALGELSGLPVAVAPEPILVGALGAALFALDSLEG